MQEYFKLFYTAPHAICLAVRVYTLHSYHNLMIRDGL